MTRIEAMKEIKARIPCVSYLKKATRGKYECPFGGSGTGMNGHGTGALYLYEDTNTFTCFSCKKSGDVIDLYMQQTGLEFSAAVADLAGELGLEIDPSFNGPANKGKPTESREKPQKAPREAAGEEAPQDAIEPDYSGYYTQCAARLDDLRAVMYLEGRGISPETARRYLVGFDPQADPAQSGHPCPRIIVPTTKSHYVGRSIDPDAQCAKLNVKGGTPGLFNKRAIFDKDAETVFVLEGAFDALSVLEAGQQAIALNSTNNAGKLIDALRDARKEGRETTATFVFCIDNDEAGEKALTTLRDGLTRLNLPFIVADICPGCKDANEALVKDKDSFLAAVADAVRRAGSRPDNVRDYISHFMAGDISRFKAERKTGFSDLDAKAGGLYGGLYVLAAISSLGKTTLAAQMADQLAAAGNDVIYFSLEQSRLELVTKSISRTVAKKTMAGEPGFAFASSLAIRKGYLPDHVLKAADDYAESVGPRLSIVEGNMTCNVSFIGDYVRHYYQKTGERPVVIVDYLQILQPPKDAAKGSKKDEIDNIITELRRLARELDTPVIAISSVNRANYLQPISFESLKESGGIEFSADVVWGLQLECLNDPLFSDEGKVREKRERVNKAKAASPRKIELVCLKNRYGIASYSCFFDYFPDRDLYREAVEEHAGDALTAEQIRKMTGGRRKRNA
jgi:replicative DNA helicase